MQHIKQEEICAEDLHKERLQQMQRVANNLLARRDYSAFEIKQKLLQKNFDEIEVDNFIQTLLEQNLLDDLRFAQSFVRYKYSQGKGANWIIQALNQKGVAQDKIRMALSEQDEVLDWQLQIQKLLNSRKFDLADFKQKAKAYRFLASRGFTSEQINSALKVDLEN